MGVYAPPSMWPPRYELPCLHYLRGCIGSQKRRKMYDSENSEKEAKIRSLARVGTSHYLSPGTHGNQPGRVGQENGMLCDDRISLGAQPFTSVRRALYRTWKFRHEG